MATFGRSSRWTRLENSPAAKKPLQASQKPAAAGQKLGTVVQKPANQSPQRTPLRPPNRIAAPKTAAGKEISLLSQSLKKASINEEEEEPVVNAQAFSASLLPPGVPDIDAADLNEPQMCAQYAQDNFDYMASLEAPSEKTSSVDQGQSPTICSSDGTKLRPVEVHSATARTCLNVPSPEPVVPVPEDIPQSPEEKAGDLSMEEMHNKLDCSESFFDLPEEFKLEDKHFEVFRDLRGARQHLRRSVAVVSPIPQKFHPRPCWTWATWKMTLWTWRQSTSLFHKAYFSLCLWTEQFPRLCLQSATAHVCSWSTELCAACTAFKSLYFFL
nr:uncharacterized protein LOC119185699 isoform X2 [Rhipicephalus microplus]